MDHNRGQLIERQSLSSDLDSDSGNAAFTRPTPLRVAATEALLRRLPGKNWENPSPEHLHDFAHPRVHVACRYV